MRCGLQPADCHPTPWVNESGYDMPKSVQLSYLLSHPFYTVNRDTSLPGYFSDQVAPRHGPPIGFSFDHWDHYRSCAVVSCAENLRRWCKWSSHVRTWCTHGSDRDLCLSSSATRLPLREARSRQVSKIARHDRTPHYCIHRLCFDFLRTRADLGVIENR